MKSLLLAAAVFLAASALAGAATPLPGSAALQCRVSFDRFSQTTSWYEAGNRLRLTADSACGDRYGFPMRLVHPVLIVEYEVNGEIRSLRIAADEGIYSPADRTVRISTHELGLITAELATGQIRSVRGFYLNMKLRNPRAFLPASS